MKTLDLDRYSHLPPISNIYDVPEWWQMTRTPLGRYTPIRGKTEKLMISPSDGQPSTAPHFPSTQAMRSRRVSSASDLLDVHGRHQSDRCSPPVRPVHRSDRSSPPVRPVWPLPDRLQYATSPTVPGNRSDRWRPAWSARC